MGTLRVVSRSSLPFSDRLEAGRLLAREMISFQDQNVVILGIPRGGIVPAFEMARILKGELDVVLAHKLRTPGHPELAMGAVAEGGVSFVDPQIVRMLNVSVSQIEQEKAIQTKALDLRAAEVRKIRPKAVLKDRVVIITDDGVATGATTMTALRAVRLEGPSKLILALPVGPEDAVRALADEADETVCLRIPKMFMAVGQFYAEFDQVNDETMLTILKKGLTRTKDNEP